MNQNKFAAVAKYFAVLPLAALLYGYPFGPGPGYAGAPGDSTCALCHGGGQVNVGGGGIALNITNYTPGEAAHVVVTISDATARRWGFEATARMASDNSQAGNLNPTDGNTQMANAGALQYIEHTLAGTRPGTSGPVTFAFDWTAPASGSSDVVFYVAANAANNNNQADSGDHIYRASITLAAAAQQQNGPMLAASNAAVNAASFTPGIAPGSWVAIFGSNLSGTTRTWRGDEFVNGMLPESLDGVTVKIDGKPAAVYYISPTQLNIQVPDDNAAGSVEVEVDTQQGTAKTTATLGAYAPGLFQYDPDNRKYVAAQHADYSIVGPAGLFQNATSTPAQPGEVIILYGTGFGPTNPATPAGMLVTMPAEIDRSKLTITIGGVQAEVQFAGITLAGVWQFNVKVPDGLPDGDAPVVAQIAGMQTQANAFLAIQNDPTPGGVAY
jgi:uncharacterized protein (TIGR03437 family)